MNSAMEKMISKDLGVEISKIRTTSWNELDKHQVRRGRAFRPKNMFIVGGNINLAENREMGTAVLGMKNICRKATYQIKCLLKTKRNG